MQVCLTLGGITAPSGCIRSVVQAPRVVRRTFIRAQQKLVLIYWPQKDGFVGLSNCEWITYSRLRVDQVAPPVSNLWTDDALTTSKVTRQVILQSNVKAIGSDNTMTSSTRIGPVVSVIKHAYFTTTLCLMMPRFDTVVTVWGAFNDLPISSFMVADSGSNYSYQLNVNCELILCPLYHLNVDWSRVDGKVLTSKLNLKSISI